MSLRNQQTAFLHFERTQHGLRGDLILANGAKLDCGTWASKREVVDIASTMVRCNAPGGRNRLVCSPNTFQQEVYKL